MREQLVPNSQWSIQVRANVFPYGAISTFLLISCHIPAGCESKQLVEQLMELDPRSRHRPQALLVGRESISTYELLNLLGRRLVEALLPEKSYQLNNDDIYSILLLTNVDPKPSIKRDFGELAALSRGLVNWKDLAMDVLDTYKKTDYGLFRSDVCYIRRRSVLAYLPPRSRKRHDARYRNKRVMRWLFQPVELAALQKAIARKYLQKFQEGRSEVLKAKYQLTDKLRNLLRTSFIQPMPLLFFRDVESFPQRLSPGERKLYRKVAAATGTDQELGRLRQEIREFVNEAEKWKSPVTAALKDTIKTAKFLLC